MLEPGIRGEADMTVAPENTAAAVGSGGLAVFATPAMISLMEKVAMQSVQPVLETGQGTVGTAIDVRHTAATPVGMRVRCESLLTAVDGRRLMFILEAFDSAGSIGTATHERFIIDNERFMQKAQTKLRLRPSTKPS